MNNLMEAAVLYAPGDLRIERVKVPDSLNADEVLVNVKAAGVCGSDLDRVMKTGTYSFPTIPGHEFCGQVEKTGKNVTGFKQGDRVLVAPILPCLKCEPCQEGHYGQCNDYNYLGSRCDGGFAQFVKAPAKNLVRIPDGISYVEAAAVEPAAVTLHGIKKAGVEPGDTVAVLGCGPIGLFAVQFVKILGATRVIAVDIAEEKLRRAREVGADICINASDADPVSAICGITENKGVSLAIETAGVSATQEQCLRITRESGRILYLGTAHKDVVFPPKSFGCIIRRELVIYGSWNSYSAPFPGVEWHATLEYIKSGKLNIKPLITHTFKLSNAPGVFKELSERKFEFNKVIFIME